MKTVLCLLVCFCVYIRVQAQRSLVYQEHISEFTHHNNLFTFDLFNFLNQKNNQNLFISPFSIRSAMATLYLGSRSKTSVEMAKIFYFDTNKQILNSNYQQYLTRYQTIEPDAPYLKILNNLWVQQDFKFLNAYQKSASQNFKASIKYLDFSGQAEASRNIINREIDLLSKHFIPKLLTPGSITDRTRLLSTNLIFLDALWQIPFNPNHNFKDIFYTNNKKLLDVEFMSIKNILVNYYETDSYQLVELPYQGEKLGMVIMLPKDERMIKQLPLNADFYKTQMAISKTQEDALMFDEIDHNAVFFPQKVDIIFPKFKFKTHIDLKEILIAMGLEDTFRESADFSGMTGAKNLFLGEAFHQTYVEVNETGTKAIAATAVSSVEKGIHEPKVFKADHPFVFMIRDHTNGCILFMGKVTNPLEEKGH